MLELDAVNRILTSAQMPVVASLASPDEFTSKAIVFLASERKRILEQGWDFNQDYDYTLTPTAGEFILPTTPWTVLAIDIPSWNSNGKDIVQRDGKLYDKTNNTFTFTESSLDATITWDIDFDDLPLFAQEYVVACSSVRFAVHVNVDRETAQFLRIEEQKAWARMKQADTQQSEASPLKRYPLAQIASKWPPIR